MKTNQKLILAAIFPILMWSCDSKTTSEETTEVEEIESIEPSLTEIWQTPAELMTNESTLFDSSTGTIYVSNIDGSPTEKDGKGSISIISKEGEILQKEWVSGIDSPKGMGISNGKLYVTNIDELVEIDIETAKISNRFKIEGAEFLNDVDTDGNKVYFSDMNTGKIHMFQDGAISTFAEGQENINGLRVGSNGVLYGLDGSGLKKYNSDGSFEMINEVVTGGDGLVVIDDNTFIASRWQGEIYLIQDGKESKILDTKAEESNTADIDYIPEDNLVLVPTFFKNKVVAYKLTY
ncbi:ATP-binding protein [Belliella sp. DSM 107340]|uniref:ATP-binding protein n=1 Tax=Belliella calami TaxID=2923436 RepID=A0ABS9UMX0_9BACT|nr:ATP-binding protein [Belliella calami]MCH7397957.1 ATP-binding protein [Belliella calami]